jgi:hypothetical protein
MEHIGLTVDCSNVALCVALPYILPCHILYHVHAIIYNTTIANLYTNVTVLSGPCFPTKDLPQTPRDVTKCILILVNMCITPCSFNRDLASEPRPKSRFPLLRSSFTNKLEFLKLRHIPTNYSVCEV